MSVDQIAQLLVTAVTTIYGYRAVAAKLTNYVPLSIYAPKVKELHDKNNELEKTQARQDERIKHLEAEIARLDRTK